MVLTSGPSSGPSPKSRPMSTAAGAHQYQGMQQPHGGPSGVPPSADLSFQHEDGEEDDGEEDDDAPAKGKGADKKAGRRKIKIEFINDKSRRHITFSKRKAGIMKKVRVRSLPVPVPICDYVSLSSRPRPTRHLKFRVQCAPGALFDPSTIRRRASSAFGTNADHKMPTIYLFRPTSFPRSPVLKSFSSSSLRLVSSIPSPLPSSSRSSHSPKARTSFRHASTLPLELSQMVALSVSQATLSIRPTFTLLRT